MKILNVAENVINKAKGLGSEKTLVRVSETTAKEFNLESNKFGLLRTTFDQNVSLRTYNDGRESSMSGNQFSETDVNALVQNSISATMASPRDEGNGFAPSQGEKVFSFGNDPCDEEFMYSSLQVLLKERERLFPKVILEGGTLKFIKTEKVLVTSEGTLFKGTHGHYEGFVMFTAKDGKQSSSFNYTSFNLPTHLSSNKPMLLQTSNLAELLRQSSEQISVKKIPAKFDGEIIVTPHCLEDLLGGWCDFLGSGRMLKKSSFFQDKLGQKVASSKFSLSSNPMNSGFASSNFWTPDGFATQNETIFENGILKSYLLNYYAGKKLGLPISRSGGSYFRLTPGDKALKELVSSVKKGILMCRYSAGLPSVNGDISGVAKNSYYIENGEILYPVSETMVSGNLSRMLNDIQDLSRETVSSGYWTLPWVKISGVTVS